ncbi:MAG: hypothetical protein RLO38_17080 [Roseovarius confluentis]
MKFIVRSGSGARRFSSSRVSRDPMGSTQIEVRKSLSAAPPKLSLDSDWSAVAKTISESEAGDSVFLLRKDGHDHVLPARAIARNGSAYIAAGETDDADSGGRQIVLDHDLFDLVLTQRVAISVDLNGKNPARLISFDGIAEMFMPDGATVFADNLQPEPEPEPEPEQLVSSVEATSFSEPRAEYQAATTANEAEAPRPEPATATAHAGDRPEGTVRLRALTSPKGFPDTVQRQLTGSLAELKSGFDAAILFQVEYIDGHTEYLVGFSGADDSVETEIENAVNAALSTSPRMDMELGIAFFDAHDPMVIRISRVGQRLV